VIVVKKLAFFLSVSFTAALLSDAALADSPAAAPELRFRTEPALGCLLGFASCAGGHRNGVVPSSLVDIRPSAAHNIIVYQRPWH
jgi:hypothetical protein